MTNQKETYKLLELSDGSDSDVDLPELVVTPRKKKSRRKHRKVQLNSTASSSLAYICNIRVMTAWIAAFLLTTWIITLTWLAIVLHSEIQRLDSTVRGVVASSQGVPDALQKCHTLSKNLQQNQTLISSQIAALKLQIENFTKEMTEMQSGLNKIQEKLNNVPEYLNVPQQLNSMSGSIANLGSQIKDITTTVASLKDSKEKLESTSNNLVQNITDLRQSLVFLQNTTQIPATVNTENSVEIETMMKVIDGIKNNVSGINTTLSNNVQWIRDDLLKNKKNIESISNIGQNMSARVTTLEGICSKTQQDQLSLSNNMKNLTDEYNALLGTVQKHSSEIIGLENEVNQLSQNSSELSTAVRVLNRSLNENKYTPAMEEGLHEREIVKVNLNSPSATVESTALPTETSTGTKENAPTGKPSVLSS